MMETRKPNRLKEYDYSMPDAYFVTICTTGKQHLLSTITSKGGVGEGLCALPQPALTDIGKKVEESILFINENVAGCTIHKYVVMPNHVHILLEIMPVFETGGHRGPPLHKIIGQLKSYTTHQYGQKLWQRSYYDHVIRGEQDYRDVWNYIETNPLRWQEDEYHCEK